MRRLLQPPLDQKLVFFTCLFEVKNFHVEQEHNKKNKDEKKKKKQNNMKEKTRQETPPPQKKKGLVKNNFVV